MGRGKEVAESILGKIAQSGQAAGESAAETAGEDPGDEAAPAAGDSIGISAPSAVLMASRCLHKKRRRPEAKAENKQENTNLLHKIPLLFIAITISNVIEGETSMWGIMWIMRNWRSGSFLPFKNEIRDLNPLSAEGNFNGSSGADGI